MLAKLEDGNDSHAYRYDTVASTHVQVTRGPAFHTHGGDEECLRRTYSWEPSERNCEAKLILRAIQAAR